MNQLFDFKRTILLARLKFSLHKKMLALSVLGFYALLFIIGFFIAYANRNSSDTFTFFTPFHFISMYLMIGLGGIAIAGRAFQDMNTPEKSIGQILIPASTFEKFILPLITTSILWIVFSLVSYHLFSLLFNGIWSLTFGYQFETFNGVNIFDVPMMFEIIMGYFLLHSAFFLGAAAFKKYPIVKTILVQFVLNWSFTLLGFVVTLILFGSMENFGYAMESLGELLKNNEWFLTTTINFDGEQIEMMSYKLRYFWRFVMFVLTGALYVTAYFKLKEREV